MNLSKIIILLSFIIIPFCAVAQNQPQIKIGAKGVPYGVNETGVAETISVADFKRDAIIHITDGNDTYSIDIYAISFLLKGGNLAGPFIIRNSNSSSNASNLLNVHNIENYLKDDTRIFIENLTATCTTCADKKTVTVKAFSIKLRQ